MRFWAYWKVILFILPIVGWAIPIALGWITPPAPSVSTLSITVLIWMLNFGFVAFIAFNVELYKTTSRIFETILQDIFGLTSHLRRFEDTRIQREKESLEKQRLDEEERRKTGTHTSHRKETIEVTEIKDIGVHVQNYLIRFPTNIFNILKFEEKSFLTHFSIHQQDNSFTTATEMDKLYEIGLRDLLPIAQQEKQTKKLFYKIFDEVKDIVSANEARIPSILYRLIVGGALLIHTILIPIFWAIYGWIGGTIVILLIVAAFIIIIDELRCLTSVFNIHAYRHDFTKTQAALVSGGIRRKISSTQHEDAEPNPYDYMEV